MFTDIDIKSLRCIMQIIIYSRKFNVEKALSSFRVTSILHRSGTASKPNQMLTPNPETRNPKPQDNLWHRFQTKWEEAACLEHPDPRKGPPCCVCCAHTRMSQCHRCCSHSSYVTSSYVTSTYVTSVCHKHVCHRFFVHHTAEELKISTHTQSQSKP